MGEKWNLGDWSWLDVLMVMMKEGGERSLDWRGDCGCVDSVGGCRLD